MYYNKLINNSNIFLKIFATLYIYSFQFPLHAEVYNDL